MAAFFHIFIRINLRMDDYNDSCKNNCLYLFNQMMMFMALIDQVRVHSFAEDAEELREKPFIHILGHLVKYEPITKRAVFDIVTNVAVISIFLEVSSDFPFDQLVSVKKLE